MMWVSHATKYEKEEVTLLRGLSSFFGSPAHLPSLLTLIVHHRRLYRFGVVASRVVAPRDLLLVPEQGVKLLGLLLTGSTGQHMAGRNGLA
jgi:hypothetical protein